jgi:transposase
MSTRRNYRRLKIKKVNLEKLLEVAVSKESREVTVGLDVAKDEIVVVIRWSDGSFERPWSVRNPSEIALLISVIVAIKDVCASVVIGLESTGTYGDAVRYAMTEAGLEVDRVSGKGVSDYKEIFDGVPSQHDGKDAAMIAELTSFGKGTRWPFQLPSEHDQRMRHQVARHEAFRVQATQWQGRLEAVLSRHWPELTKLTKLSSVTLLKICTEYGSPALLAADADAAAKVRRWGSLPWSRANEIVESARATKGIPIGAGERAWLMEIAAQVRHSLNETKACLDQLREIAEHHPVMRKFVDQVGATTLCVIWVTVGDPAKYTSSGAFLKAFGLNLKELSSGKRKGELAITKRGPGLARKYLYYWALRAVKHPDLKCWYANFRRVGRGGKNSSEHRSMKGLIATMRKLGKSLWYTRRHDLKFRYANVFPGEPLQKRRIRRRGAVIIQA